MSVTFEDSSIEPQRRSDPESAAREYLPHDHLIAYGEGGKICGSRDSQVPAVARPTHSPVEGVLRNALRTHIDDELAALFFRAC